MRRSTALLFLLALPALPAAAGPLAWNGLRPGMSAEEAVAALGEPLIRTSARGLEVWIYDSCGEVVFSGGPVKDWSLPVPNEESAAKPLESDVLIRPVPRVRPLRSAPVRGSGPVEAVRGTEFRYLPRFR